MQIQMFGKPGCHKFLIVNSLFSKTTYIKFSKGWGAEEQKAIILQKEYKNNRRYLTGLLSPQAIKRLKEFCGDISKFKIDIAKPCINELKF